MRVYFFAIIAALFFLIGCGGDEGDSIINVNEAPETCVPGAVDPCFCDDVTVGSQVCDGTGKRYETCNCPDQPNADAGVHADADTAMETGSDAQTPCTHRVRVIENLVEPQAVTAGEGSSAIFPIFMGVERYSEADCAEDAEVDEIIVHVRHLDGPFDLPNEHFKNIRLMAEDLSVISGPVTFETVDATTMALRFTDPITLLFYHKLRNLRVMLDLGGTEEAQEYPLAVQRYQFSVASVHTAQADAVIDYELEADNVLSITYPSPLAVLGIQPSDRIKGSGTTIYFVGEDWKRYAFPDTQTYATWFEDWEGIKIITDAELALIPLGGNVTIRPGTKLVKIQTDPKVYAVTNCGTLHWLESEAVAAELYGPNWKYRVVDVPDAFFITYIIGDPITMPVHPDGQLIYDPNNPVKRWVVWEGKRRPISDEAAFISNHWDMDDVVPTTIQYPDGLPVTGPEPEKFWQVACSPN